MSAALRRVLIDCKLSHMRVSIGLWLLLLAACGDSSSIVSSGPPGRAPGDDAENKRLASNLVSVQQGQCAACHSLGEAMDRELAASPAQPIEPVSGDTFLAAWSLSGERLRQL